MAKLFDRVYVRNFLRYVRNTILKALAEEDAETLLAIKELVDTVGDTVDSALCEGYTRETGTTFSGDGADIIIRVYAEKEAKETPYLALADNLSPEVTEQLLKMGAVQWKTRHHSAQKRQVRLAKKPQKTS